MLHSIANGSPLQTLLQASAQYGEYNERFGLNTRRAEYHQTRSNALSLIRNDCSTNCRIPHTWRNAIKIVPLLKIVSNRSWTPDHQVRRRMLKSPFDKLRLRSKFGDFLQRALKAYYQN